MRSTTFSGFAVLASLLAGEAFGAPFQKRDVVIDQVVVTDVITVTALADGQYATGEAVAVGTLTIPGVTTIIVTTPVATPTPSVEAPVVKAPVVESSTGGVFLQASSVEPTTAPVSTPAPVIPSVVVPTVAPAPIPTTLATVAAPIPTTAPAPVSTPVSTPSGGKRGLAYNDISLLSDFVSSEVSWCYNWGATSGGTVPSGLSYTPMLWGLGDHVNGWTENAQSAIDSGAEYLLGFNEPDQPNIYGGSAISVADAVTGWSNMEQFAGKAKLGAPAVSNGGLSWLTQFLADCSGCTIDFVPFHWYDNPNNDLDYFKSYISQVHAAAPGKPLWLTEFAATGSTEVQAAFATEAMAYLDSLDYVERYSYFMVAEGDMVTNSVPNALGKVFAGL